MNTPANSNQNLSTEAPVSGAGTCSPAQLGDLANHILCYGAFSQKFEPALLPAGAQAEMYRCEESLSWILVWFVNGRPVMACDYFDHFTYILDRTLLAEAGQ